MKARKLHRLEKNYKIAHAAYWNHPLAGEVPSHEEPEDLMILGNKLNQAIYKRFN